MKSFPPPVTCDQPASRRPCMKIIHADHRKKVEVIIVNEREYGVMIHWDDQLLRNQPCTGTFCKCNERHMPICWKAYLGCWDIARNQLAIAELTSPAWQEAGLLAIREKRGTLRGIKVQLSRAMNQRAGRVIAKLYNVDPILCDSLPPPFDVGEELKRIWYSRQ